VVECKYYNRKLTIKLVESFIGFLEDVGLSDGIIVTNIGVSKPAAKRVALSAIRIRVLSEDDLKGYKIAGLMPWQDN
jgi:ferredoxin-fold anticodon binding domain-containing protein